MVDHPSGRQHAIADSIDLVARKVVMLSLLYYSLDASLVPDTEFDLMCKRLYDEWDDLSPIRQWQLEPREDIRASGFHVKVTTAASYGALAWADKVLKNNLHMVTKKEWQRHPEHGRWLPCDAFSPVEPPKRKRKNVRPKAGRSSGDSQGGTTRG